MFTRSLLIMSTCLMGSYGLAHADSFCGFDEGLIGTKAIGYVSPFYIGGYDYDAGICEVEIVDSKSNQSNPIVKPCIDFQHVPSSNIDHYADEDGFDPVGSDYFQFQVFDAQDLWVQIALKSGQKKWTKLKSQPYGAFPYQYVPGKEIKSYAGHPTQGMIFSEPRLDKPAYYLSGFLRNITDFWIAQTIPPDFFQHEVFQLAAQYDVFDPSHIENAKIATHYGEFLHIGYDLKDIIRDDEGREWLKAQEYLTISRYDFEHFVEREAEALGKPLSKEDSRRLLQIDYHNLRSDAGRIVYFPYREPSGTITMVLSDGPDCD